MKRQLLAGLVLAALTAVQPALGDEATVRKNFEERVTGVKVQSVHKTPYAGLYEVLLEGHLVYTDENADYLFIGNVFDAKTQDNLTRERVAELQKVDFAKLPFAKAMKVVKGTGRRQLAVFSDPDCPYCKRLEEELKNVDDVTVYLFLTPIASLHPQAEQKSRAIWCAPDRLAAWNAWMLKGVPPKGAGNCPNPVAETVELAEKLQITGTPTLIFADGSRVPGMVKADKLNQMLDEAKAPAPTAPAPARGAASGGARSDQK